MVPRLLASASYLREVLFILLHVANRRYPILMN